MVCLALPRGDKVGYSGPVRTQHAGRGFRRVPVSSGSATRTADGDGVCAAKVASPGPAQQSFVHEARKLGVLDR